MSYLGDSLGLVALMLHVAETTGQALAVALLLLAGDFAPAPSAASLSLGSSDRSRPRRRQEGCHSRDAPAPPRPLVSFRRAPRTGRRDPAQATPNGTNARRLQSLVEGGR